MNIFILDNNITKNVQYYADKHVVKMILEHVQILSTVVNQSGINTTYKPTHINHPCTKWAASSLSNWKYLYNLTEQLHKEWQYRYNHIKDHKSYIVMKNLPNPNINDIGLTDFALAMPNKYKCNNIVDSYRNYYKYEKNHLFKWTKREKPEWLQKMT